MTAPPKGWQKIVAYGSLFFVLACTVLGIGMIWLILTETKV